MDRLDKIAVRIAAPKTALDDQQRAEVEQLTDDLSRRVIRKAVGEILEEAVLYARGEWKQGKLNERELQEAADMYVNAALSGMMSALREELAKKRHLLV